MFLVLDADRVGGRWTVPGPRETPIDSVSVQRLPDGGISRQPITTSAAAAGHRVSGRPGWDLNLSIVFEDKVQHARQDRDDYESTYVDHDVHDW